jgi:hypothetical protein
MNCGHCGHALFGDVAYCPYCGRSAADRDAMVPLAGKQEPASERATAPADRPGMRWNAGWKALVTAAVALTFVAAAVKELAVTAGTSEPSDRVAAPRAEAVMPHADTVPPQPQVQAPAPAPAPAPQAPNRSLCSAANEAAGLCNPQ